MRAASILVLLAWIPAILSGSGAKPVPLTVPAEVTATGIAPHDLGPSGWLAFESAGPSTPTQATVRSGDGPVPGPPVSIGSGTRRFDAHRTRLSVTGSRDRRLLDHELDTVRARTGFLTAVLTNAPPRSSG